MCHVLVRGNDNRHNWEGESRAAILVESREHVHSGPLLIVGRLRRSRMTEALTVSPIAVFTSFCCYIVGQPVRQGRLAGRGSRHSTDTPSTSYNSI
ncbi:hypothetical protein BD310DRAFT_563779 [Dichomitus squalens]|uniref:Uncharacterized protein n=1 Tax=Dichomitus squalens TaxID=114155 RepID=A0A4Q9PS07_9APHY|nr:hypothetical protein BD310DRAFT_563779 [Dichomitus squalens]